MAKLFGLPKTEKLKSRKLIEALFAGGQRLHIFPVRVFYKFVPAATVQERIVQIGVTASRKNFKRAVDRNRIKRLLREAYRLQKGELLQTLQQGGRKGYVFFIYTGKMIASFEEIKAVMKKCVHQLQQKAVSTHESTG